MPSDTTNHSSVPPQLTLAALIFQEGSWGAFQHGAKPATRKEVETFFDKVIAICDAESSFNPRADNGVHKGLFQIDVNLHKDKIAGRDIFDPVVNVQVAAAISRDAFKAGKDQFQPWTSYTMKSPRYLASRGWGKRAYDYVATSSGTVGASGSGSDGSADTGGSLSFGDLFKIGNLTVDKLPSWASMGAGEVASSVLSFVKQSALVVGVFLIGLIAIGVGLYMLANSTKTGNAAIKSVKGKAGTAAKAAALL